MSTKEELNDSILSQTFPEEDGSSNSFAKHLSIASNYAKVENAIAVLTDYKENVSYIYYGKMAKALGLDATGKRHIIHTIWDDEVFHLVAPEDQERGHLEELYFFHYMKKIPLEERSDYYMESFVRMARENGDYVPVRHRIFYIASQPNGSIRIALCLYTMATDASTETHIHNTINGVSFPVRQHDYGEILSEREKDVLRLIHKGKQSKEIADTLSISIHTVNRHRQNILKKLRAANSFEACKIANQMRIFNDL